MIPRGHKSSIVALAIGAGLLLACSDMQAEVALPAVLADHMVLQRGRPVHLWGLADPGEKIRVSFRGDKRDATADSLGRWSVYLAPGSAGGPFAALIEGKNQIKLADVLVGDLWLASGQSNMEFPMRKSPPWTDGVKDADAEISSANHPKLRLFQVKRSTSSFPMDDLAAKQSWTACTPETVASFSAVAYFFGRELLEKEGVPIGLIESDVGGTPAEAWTSLDALSSDASLMPVFSARAHMMDGASLVLRQQKVEDAERVRAKAEGKKLTDHPWRPDPATWEPAALFNAMIAPLTSLPLRGVIWYQGESNTDQERAPIYEHVFSTMIKDWRTRWAQGDFPFLFVQIANFNSSDAWPEVREAQRRTLALANTGMAVAIDIGDTFKIHPMDKQDVGHRLALWARADVYGEKLEDSGPLFRQAVPDGARMRMWFDHAGSGLAVKGESLRGFEVAGEDRKFMPADAYIDGDTVIAGSAAVANPLYVRYGWKASPDCTLYNNDNLPASPFTFSPMPSVKQ